MPTNDDFNDFWKEERKVPCNGCQKCCQGEQVVLKPQDGDIVENYQAHQAIHNGEMVMALDHKENGDCVYLTEAGCGIHERRPIVCRTFDCRVAFLTFTRAMRKDIISKNQGNKIFEEGKKRLHTLDSRGRRGAIMVRKFREEARLKYGK